MAALFTSPMTCDWRACPTACSTLLAFSAAYTFARLYAARVLVQAMGTVDRAQPRHLVAWELCQYFVLWNSRKTCYIEWVS